MRGGGREINDPGRFQRRSCPRPVAEDLDSGPARAPVSRVSQQPRTAEYPRVGRPLRLGWQNRANRGVRVARTSALPPTPGHALAPRRAHDVIARGPIVRVQGRIATLRCDVITGVHVAEGDWLSGDANCREVWKIGQLSRGFMEDDVIRKRWKSWTARFWTEGRGRRGFRGRGDGGRSCAWRARADPEGVSATAVVQAGPTRARARRQRDLHQLGRQRW